MMVVTKDSTKQILRAERTGNTKTVLTTNPLFIDLYGIAVDTNDDVWVTDSASISPSNVIGYDPLFVSSKSFDSDRWLYRLEMTKSLEYLLELLE